MEFSVRYVLWPKDLLKLEPQSLQKSAISRYLVMSIIIDCYSVAKIYRKYVECAVKNVERRMPNASSVFLLNTISRYLDISIIIDC